jgi:hypothetical protein
MKNFVNISIIFFLLITACSNGNDQEPAQPQPTKQIEISVNPVLAEFTSDGGTQNVIVDANVDWSLTSSQSWCTVSALKGYAGQTSLKISVTKNPFEAPRTAELIFAVGDTFTKTIIVSQQKGKLENYVPQGYSMVWSDEFNTLRQNDGKPALPSLDNWWFEKGAGGWGNNEVQNYVDRFVGTDTCSIVSDGTLKIIAKKRNQEVISIRMNTVKSWQYGYFEARLRMPSGKGTWPAFWMLPKDFKSWPLDGEIDIMEYVGYDPNVVHASIHTMSYNHAIGTQKTSTYTVQNAETEFHIYGLEWTADKITAYVDGQPYFSFENDGKGDVNTWPFNKPFYLKLNLAWGGNWGGAQGVDESKLPATYEIDYVRVYQK